MCLQFVPQNTATVGKILTEAKCKNRKTDTSGTESGKQKHLKTIELSTED